MKFTWSPSVNSSERCTQGRSAGLTWIILLGSNQLIQPVNKHLSNSGSRPALCEMQGLLQDAASQPWRTFQAGAQYNRHDKTGKQLLI